MSLPGEMPGNTRNGQLADVEHLESHDYSDKVLPQTPTLFNDTPESLAEEANRLIQSFQATVDNIVAHVDKSDATFDNIITPFAEMENEYILHSRRIKFYASTNQDKEVRNASLSASKLLASNQTDFYMRDDFYQLVDQVSKNTEGGQTLASQDAYYLQKLLQEFQRKGVALPLGSKREQLKEVQKRIDDLTADGRKNFNANTRGLQLERHELDGLSESFVERLTPKNQDGSESAQDAGTQLWIRMKDPDVNPILKNATLSTTRRKVYEGNMGRVEENAPVYEEVFALRRKAAQLMGFASYAEYRISYRMVRSVDYVNSMLNEIKEKAQKQRDLELKALQELKNQERLSNNVPAEPQLYIWDRVYYDRLMREKQYDLDHNLVSEYFPLEHSLGEMFKIYETIFGVHAVEVPPQPDWVWHETVKMYSIWDMDDEDQFLGFLYLDIFPREAKYSHAGHYCLNPGFIRPSGQRHYPSSALVLNFLQSSKEKPSLLTHDDLRKLFHELGHGMHNILSKTKFGRFHGTNVDGDFQEIPARMFENFVWNPTTLSSISCHYSHLSPEYLQAWEKEQASKDGVLEQPPKHLAEDMAERLNQGKYINGAIYKMLQLHHSIFDLTAHSQADRDLSIEELSALYDDLRHELSGLAGVSAIGGKPSKAFSAFRAIVGSNYDAGYYTYVLADVFSLDLFYTGFEGDMLDPARGRKFRYAVLQPGGSKSEWETMTEYLGREPNTDAFYRELGWPV